MRAGFFVREPDGKVNASQSHLEFSFPDRLAAAFDHRGTFADRRAAEQRIAPRVASPPAVAAEDARRYAESSVQPLPPMTSLFGEPVPELELTDEAKASSVKKWFGLGVALIVVAVLVIAGTRLLSSGPVSETIALSVVEREGQLDIEWNRAAAPVSKAVRGTLEIADGVQTRTIPLTPGELSLGKFSYKRDTGDIQVRMSVEGPDGNKVQEASRFLGPPPSKGNVDELKALQENRDELEAEIARLKRSNDQQAQRIQQLERTLKILQTRPGVN
jgi:hypothetical protein